MRVGIEKLHTVNAIMRHPDVYEMISDDYSTPVEEFDAGDLLLNPNVWFLYPSTGVLLMLHAHNGITYEVHTQVLPEYRGRGAIKAAKRAVTWMFDNSPMQKLITHVPEFNKAALMFAKWCGLHVEGENHKSFLKNGKLFDQTLLGVCKEDWVCQQRQQQG